MISHPAGFLHEIYFSSSCSPDERDPLASKWICEAAWVSCFVNALKCSEDTPQGFLRIADFCYTTLIQPTHKNSDCEELCLCTESWPTQSRKCQVSVYLWTLHTSSQWAHGLWTGARGIIPRRTDSSDGKTWCRDFEKLQFYLTSA